MSKLRNIDQFYLYFGILLLVLSVLVILVIRGIFSSITISREIDQEFLESQTPRLHKESLSKAYELIMNSKVVVLDLGE